MGKKGRGHFWCQFSSESGDKIAKACKPYRRREMKARITASFYLVDQGPDHHVCQIIASIVQEPGYRRGRRVIAPFVFLTGLPWKCWLIESPEDVP